MKKTAAVFLIAASFAVARASAAPSLPPLASLPVGDTNKMLAQLDKEVIGIAPVVRFEDGSQRYGQYVAYDPTMGSVTDVARQLLPSVFNNEALADHVGETASFELLLQDRVTGYYASAVSWLSARAAARTFTVSLDGGGNVVTPTGMLDWPIVSHIPISGALAGVQMVEYVNYDRWPNPRQALLMDSRTGLMCEFPGLETNNILFVEMHFISSDYIRTNYPVREVRLYYAWTGGVYKDGFLAGDTSPMYDAFDMLTGEKTHTCGVKLTMEVKGGQPSVTVVSAPGTQVEIQSSTDLVDWTVDGNTVVDADASSRYAPSARPKAGGTLFFRGRRVYP